MEEDVNKDGTDMWHSQEHIETTHPCVIYWGQMRSWSRNTEYRVYQCNEELCFMNI